MTSGLDDFLHGMGEVLDKAPQLYDDALKPAAQETGKLLARPLRLVNAALVGFDKWMLNREAEYEQAKLLIAKKLQDQDESNITEIEPYIAVPALQALSYAMESEGLRDLYANLIAKAMIKDTKGSVHPAFVEIIKQMSPNDATYFKMLASLNSRHIADIHGAINDDDFDFKFEIIKERVNFFSENYTDEEVSIIMNSLTRLGLIETTADGTTITYEDDDGDDFIQRVEALYNTSKYPSYKRIIINHKTVLITDFGELFNNICVRG